MNERRVLAETERALRRDRRLRRRLTTFRLGRQPWQSVLAVMTRTRVVLCLIACSVGLMLTGMTTGEPAVIWAFAAVWTLTLVTSFVRLCRYAA